MARKALLIVILVVFSAECLVLAALLCRAWTAYYIRGPANADYAAVYRDKVEDGHHPVTAEIDAGTTSFAIWWGGVICLFAGVGVGGPMWAYRQLWASKERRCPREVFARGPALLRP